MEGDDNRLVFDQFTDSVRYLSTLTAVFIGFLTILTGTWFFFPLFLVIAGGVFLVRQRLVIDLQKETARDERGFYGTGRFFTVPLAMVSSIEVGFIDVPGRYGTSRVIRVELLYRDDSNPPYSIALESDLGKASSIARKILVRTGIPITISEELQQLKSQIGELTRPYIKIDG